MEGNHDDLQYVPKWKGSTNSKAVCSCMFPGCYYSNCSNVAVQRSGNSSNEESDYER